MAAGAEPFVGRAARAPRPDGDVLDGFVLSSGERLRADVVIGADGATSRVADVAGLVDPARVLWGFALRAYVDDPVTVPAHRAVGAERRGAASPATDGCSPGSTAGPTSAWVSACSSDRRAGAARHPALRRLRRAPAAARCPRRAPPTPARSRTASAAGSSWAWSARRPPGAGCCSSATPPGWSTPSRARASPRPCGSGRAAAEAVLAGPGRRRRPLPAVPRRHATRPTSRSPPPVHAALLPRPRAVAAVGRLLTAPGVGPRASPAAGRSSGTTCSTAPPRARPGRVASAAARLGRAVTSRSRTRTWFAREFQDGPGG